MLAAGAWLRSVRGTPSPQTHYSFFEADLRKEVEGLAQHPFVARRVQRPMNALGRGFIVARNPFFLAIRRTGPIGNKEDRKRKIGIVP